MDTKALIWVLFGLLLIGGGMVLTLQDAQKHPRQENQVLPTATRADREYETGFAIDPVKGLRRKDENQEYFK